MNFYAVGLVLILGFAAGAFVTGYLAWRTGKGTKKAIETLANDHGEARDQAAEARGAAIERAAGDQRARDVLAVSAAAQAAIEDSNVSRTIEETVIRHVEETPGTTDTERED